jgi:hypothetical protein
MTTPASESVERNSKRIFLPRHSSGPPFNEGSPHRPNRREVREAQLDMKGNSRGKTQGEKKKRGRPRIRTAEYWREYYRQKQREWRAVHLYGISRKAVIRLFGEGRKNDCSARVNGRELTSHKSHTRQKESQRAARRRTSLRK